MLIRRRLSQTESRLAALEAARLLLIELGPQAVTLKAVAARIDRTHANLLHHFGSAAGLQKELARYIARNICGSIAKAVVASRSELGTPREVVDLTFDAFGKEGAGALASWMLLSGNEDALDPIVDAIHDMVDELHEGDAGSLRESTLKLVLLALGDSLMGGPLALALGLERTSIRQISETMLETATMEFRQRASVGLPAAANHST
jgi:AcrR family transcriptional regulator